MFRGSFLHCAALLKGQGRQEKERFSGGNFKKSMKPESNNYEKTGQAIKNFLKREYEKVRKYIQVCFSVMNRLRSTICT